MCLSAAISIDLPTLKSTKYVVPFPPTFSHNIRWVRVRAFPAFASLVVLVRRVISGATNVTVNPIPVTNVSFLNVHSVY